ncbi:exonuclease subunit SbcD [Chitinimonas koreensis]|uniref:exonuclease subunit SbcD n=1 Tax=Chitinimonas koreensis TaxID=356302 RepID=UPI0027E4F780|nr:exonuclease subunit SbcD [Chitinimonas koreensis]
MRILHTSDWHLGQHFMGKTRQDEHQAFVAWLVDQVEAHQVDAVLIAGDIFDTGAPPSYAREIYNALIVSLHDTGAQLVVLAGNHDSVATLGESKHLLARLGTHVIPAVADSLESQLLVLKNRAGQAAALLCAIPFIRPRDVMQSQAGQSAEEKQLSLKEAIHAHYQQLYALAEARRTQYETRLPIVATGHLTTVGASASESVREIYVGSLEAFPTAAFPPADYIALGHIHRPQKVGGWNIFATAARLSRSVLMNSASAKKCCWWIWTKRACSMSPPSPCPCFSRLPVSKAPWQNSAQPSRPQRNQHCRGIPRGWRSQLKAMTICLIYSHGFKP